MAVCTSILAIAASCASAEPGPRAEPAPTPSERIAELRAAIAEDHTTLEQLITRPREEAEEPLHADPTLRAISRRLGEQERELAALLEAESKHGPGGTTR